MYLTEYQHRACIGRCSVTNILLVAGFLGSGKTAVIAKLIDQLTNAGRRVCVIENEAGTFGVDDLLLDDNPVKVTSLSGGCVCCQLTGQLIDALHTIRADYGPEQVIVELSGVAYPAALPEQIARYLGSDCPVTVLTVADAARWRVLSHAAAPLLRNQLRDSQVQLVTKLDLAEDGETVCEQVRAWCRTPCIFRFQPDGLLPEELTGILCPEEGTQ